MADELNDVPQDEVAVTAEAPEATITADEPVSDAQQEQQEQAQAEEQPAEEQPAEEQPAEAEPATEEAPQEDVDVPAERTPEPDAVSYSSSEDGGEELSHPIPLSALPSTNFETDPDALPEPMFTGAPIKSTAHVAAAAAKAAENDAFYVPPPDHATGEVDDLATLTNLTQQTLLKELEVRYHRDTIYTFVSDILVSVNPFKDLSLYTKDTAAKYVKKSRFEVPPHVYVIADACYHNLFKNNKNQCAVISGESGAGKTWSAKLIINYIIELCKSGEYGNNLEDQIIQVNPLLEAFGNAQTVMNDNSSRFGKYTRLLFDGKGNVMGVQLSEYLLEKSRVMEQAANERNFHIFYYLFAHADKDKYMLTKPSDYPNMGGQLWEDNATMYNELMGALDVVGFSAEQRDEMFAILAAILHLSNVLFENDGREHAMLKNPEALKKAAQLLKVDEAKLEDVLLGLNTVTRGEHIRRLYTAAQAYDCRDALAKALYGSLFGWIVQSVNELLAPELNSLKKAGGRPGAAMRAAPTHEIGVLDIFGFENFKRNSFEQICINVAHEQLQFFFNQHTFRLELEEYEKEGIEGASITFTDNMPLITMFLDKPIGVFSLLDEECSFPKATDQSFVDKLDKHFSDNPSYVLVKMSRGYPAFTIKHFAATVEYAGTNMLEKNRDNLAQGIVDVVRASGVDIVADVFNGEILATGQIRARKRTEEDTRTRRGEVVQDTAGEQTKANRRAPSLSSQFRNSLDQLIKRMNMCDPHFVRCIKPNHSQQANNFVEDFVLTQLSYTGVLEATRIRQEGYSWRPAFDEFVRRYKILGFPVTKLNQVKESEASAVKIIQLAGLKNWKVGKTKLFLKYYHMDQLERAIQQFYRNIVIAQNAWRRHQARKEYNKRLARARMNAAQRAEAERLEAEQRARDKAEREAREAAELERQRLLREQMELEVKKAEEIRRAQELEAKKAEAEAERIRQENIRIQDAAEAERALQLAAQREEEARQAMEERERALAEAEEARRLSELKQKEIDELARAAEAARREAQETADSLRREAFERTKSRKKREEDIERQAELARRRAEEEARLAEEARVAREAAEEEARRAEQLRRESEALEISLREAGYQARLEKMREEAEAARKRAEEEEAKSQAALRAKQEAEEAARRVEAERQAELQKMKEEKEAEAAARRAADFRRPDFDLAARVKELLGEAPNTPAVTVTDKVCKGYLLKLGNVRKSWKRRYFVLDLHDMTFKYFDKEGGKKEKQAVNIDEITRSFKPRFSSSGAKATKAPTQHQQIVVLEHFSRSFWLEAPSPEALNIWTTVFQIVTNPDVRNASDA